MAGNRTFDCFHDSPFVSSNEDVSGPGTLVGFLGTAYLVVLIVTAYYFVAFEPRSNPFASSGKISAEQQRRCDANKALLPVSSASGESNPAAGDAHRESDRDPSHAHSGENRVSGEGDSSCESSDSESDVSDNENPQSPPNHALDNAEEKATVYRHGGTSSTSAEGTELRQRIHSAIQPGSDASAIPSQAHESHENQDAGSNAEHWRPNPIDMMFLNFVHKWMSKIGGVDIGPKLSKRLDRAFSKCILGFCDAQIVTGIGIMVSTFGSLPGENGISSYHWQVAVYLAWFANLTHLTALTFLRKHFYQHTTERNWRVVSMISLFGLLFVAEVPTAFFNWNSPQEPSAANASSYARCFFNLSTAQLRFDDAVGSSAFSSWNDSDIGNTDSALNTILSILLLSFSFSTRLVKMSRKVSTLARNHIRGGVGDILKRLIRRCAHLPPPRQGRRAEVPFWRCLKPLASLFLTARLYSDLYVSMMSEIYFLWLSAAWGTIHLFLSRASASPQDGFFTFGQILSIVLLILPIVSIVTRLFPILNHLWKAIRDNRRVSARSGKQSLTRIPDWDSAYSYEVAYIHRDITYHSPWMIPTLFMMIGQIIYFSAMLIVFLITTGSAWRTIVSYSLWFCLTQPTAVYFMVLLSLTSSAEEARVVSLCTGVVNPTARAQSTGSGNNYVALLMSWRWALQAIFIFVCLSILPYWFDVTGLTVDLGLYALIFFPLAFCLQLLWFIFAGLKSLWMRKPSGMHASAATG